jgi:hypothetical protein
MMSSIKFLRPTGVIWAFYNVSFIIILAFGPDFLMAQGCHTEAASAMVSTTSWMLILGVPLGAWLADLDDRPTHRKATHAAKPSRRPHPHRHGVPR